MNDRICEIQGMTSSTILEPNARTQVATTSFLISVYKFDGVRDIMEQDTLILEKRILHFLLAVKHPKRQESHYKLLYSAD